MKLLLLLVVVLSLVLSNVIADAQAEERYDYYDSYPAYGDWCPRHKECCTVFVPPVTKTACNRFTRATTITYSTSAGAVPLSNAAICTTGCGLTVCDGTTSASVITASTSSLITLAPSLNTVSLTFSNTGITVEDLVGITGFGTGIGSASTTLTATGPGLVTATVSVPVSLTNTITTDINGAPVVTTTSVTTEIVPITASVSASNFGPVILGATALLTFNDVSITGSVSAVADGVATVPVTATFLGLATTAASAVAPGTVNQYIFCEGDSSLSCVTCVATSTLGSIGAVTSTCVGVSVSTSTAPTFPF